MNILNHVPTHQEQVLEVALNERERFANRVQEVDLNIKDRLFLATLLRTNDTGQMAYLEPLKHQERKITTTDYLQKEMMNYLFDRNLITPDRRTPISAYRFTEDNVSFDLNDLYWQINVIFDGDKEELIKKLTYPSGELIMNDKEIAYQLWRKVAYDEVLGYLLHQMNRVGYYYEPGDRTRMVFERLLDNFSVAQIYGIIYRNISYSTHRFQAGEITRKHAENSIIASCEGYGERAVANGWQIGHYNRIRELPESIISSVLFTSIMEIGELGFYEIPTKDI